MKKRSAIIIGFIIALIRFLWVQDKRIVSSFHTYKSERVPSSFDGFRMTQVSDFHNMYIGKDSKILLDKVSETRPDVILVTGDAIDRRTPNEQRALKFLQDLTDIAPTYYVTGNHEAYYRKFEDFYMKVIMTDVISVCDRDAYVHRGDDYIKISGVHDVRVFGDDTNPNLYVQYEDYLEERFFELEDKLTILLAHRPDLIHMYSTYDVDLIFSGHAHGGQFRVPFIGGLYAPDQGILPKYTEGMHEMNGSKMYISRGLGNSRFPWRLFNQPELVVVDLKREA
ncbi:metallophosphoesterase [Phocicoccus pinnipedialis]|uniref:Putative metallophosphoesterase n=1 Tax=Phocicoccus pinnipedialis TaxID=110845 RepID=A0A6V7R4V7_9BACL|nr:metallophosphoesterase [Jeotgalicoccus pinnipedialis]MBP1939978.1 putative MPP superfamily phosphohydrolase [Jeotgalicoccus pinnipedialis]CAD2072074.1 putative metallophosphoesterase [Jeotgalicoccus pinnipedialis]